MKTNQKGAGEFSSPMLTRILLICAPDGFLPDDLPRMFFTSFEFVGYRCPLTIWILRSAGGKDK